MKFPITFNEKLIFERSEARGALEVTL